MIAEAASGGGGGGAAAAHAEARPAKVARVLRPHASAASSVVSAISAISDDAMSMSPIGDLSSESSVERELRASAASVLPPAKGALRGMISKKPAGCTRPRAASVSCGTIMLQNAARKSYVMFMDAETEKWKLVVQSEHEGHKEKQK